MSNNKDSQDNAEETNHANDTNNAEDTNDANDTNSINKQSVSSLINELFAHKPQAKRKQWIELLEDEEIESVEDLKSMSEKLWESLKLPSIIKEQLQKALKPEAQSPQNPVTPVKPVNQVSELEINIIVHSLNDCVPTEKILKILGTQAGSERETFLRDYISSLIQPPKPLPKDSKQLTVKINQKTLPVFHYQGNQVLSRKYYTLLIIGETGSGKTTLLDAFVNKLTGMNIQDQWRWKLVNEDKFKDLHTSMSQTTDINQYFINDVDNKFNIRIIDTPGFGDTGGIEKDDEIIKKFESYFKTIDELDYILVTIHSSKTRLTAGTKYVLNRVQEIFGKDAVDRFLLICTFADDKQPAAVETVKGYLTYQQYFQFNNSALYTPISDSSSMTSFYWKMGFQSVEKFMEYVIKHQRIPLSLHQSKNVLRLRDYLKTQIKTSQDKIMTGLSQSDATNNTIKEIEQNKKKIDANQSFKITTYREVIEKIPLEKTYQMCQNCQKTCCQICVWPANATESQCSYFNSKDACPQCNGCPKSKHIRADYLIVKKQVGFEEEVSYKKLALEEGQQGLKKSEILLNNQKQQLKNLGQEILNQLQTIKSSMAELESIAIKPQVFTDVDYFKELIKEETDSKKQGWESRVNKLEEMVKLAQIAIQASQVKSTQNQNVLEHFPQYKQKLESFCTIF